MIKKIHLEAEYDSKIIQRLVGHLSCLLPFVKSTIYLLKPMYLAISAKRNFCFTQETDDLREGAACTLSVHRTAVRAADLPLSVTWAGP